MTIPPVGPLSPIPPPRPGGAAGAPGEAPPHAAPAPAGGAALSDLAHLLQAADRGDLAGVREWLARFLAVPLPPDRTSQLRYLVQQARHADPADAAPGRAPLLALLEGVGLAAAAQADDAARVAEASRGALAALGLEAPEVAALLARAAEAGAAAAAMVPSGGDAVRLDPRAREALRELERVEAAVARRAELAPAPRPTSAPLASPLGLAAVGAGVAVLVLWFSGARGMAVVLAVALALAWRARRRS